MKKVFLWGILLAIFIHIPLQAKTINITAADSFFIGESDSTTYIEAQTGSKVINAGDINHDGIDDFLIGAPGSDFPHSNEGKVYLVLGAQSYSATVNLSNMASSFIGGSISSSLGDIIGANGDLNGDGYNDFVFGIYNKGYVSVFLGNADLWITNENALSSGVSFKDKTTRINLGRSVSIKGDVNGDGYDDLIMGAPQYGAGLIFLYYGRNSISGSTIDPAALEQYSETFTVFEGETDNDQAGYSSEIIPDINKDGFDEVLIGSYLADGSKGRVYLFYGKRGGLGATLNLAMADATIIGPEAGVVFSQTISGLGDINGDGYGDFAIGAPLKGAAREGAVYIYYGGAEAMPSINYAVSADAILKGTYSLEHAGELAIASMGDFNGDLLNDLIIGAYKYDYDKGKAYLIYGSQTKLSGEKSLSQADEVFLGTQESDKTGYSVSSAGDTNRDGIDELLIGIPYNNAVTKYTGKVAFFKLQTNVTPSAIIEVSLTNVNGNVISTVTNRDTIYITLTGTDNDASKKNIVEVEGYSTTATRPITIRLLETGVNTGIFKGTALIVRSRSSKFMRQISAGLGDTVYVRAKNNTNIKATTTVSNSPPGVNNIVLIQEGNGYNTKIRVDYLLSDYDINNCNFNTSATQVQYKKETDTSWTDAVLSGYDSHITSLENGKQHNANFEPLYLSVGYVEGNYHVRIKPHDGTVYASSYLQSSVFHVDNTAPKAPVLAQPNNKYAYQISVTGSAEADSLIYVYVENAFTVTASVDSLGYFEAFPINVTATKSVITAICQDSAGNRSVTSNAITIQFGETKKSLKDGNVSVEMAFPFSGLTFDKEPKFSILATADLQTSYGNPPASYFYVTGFDLGFGADKTIDVSGEIVVTINIPQEVEATKAVAVFLWTGAKWSTRDVTLNIVIGTTTGTIISFSPGHFSKFAVAQLSDPLPPIIGRVKLNGTYIVTDNYYANNPGLSVSITDAHSGVASWSIALLEAANNNVYSSWSSGNINLKEINISVTPNTSLKNTAYYIQITAWDNGMLTATYRSSRFYVNNAIFYFSALQAPNPFNPGKDTAYIAYNLSKNANVDIYILNQAGSLVKSWTYKDNENEGITGYHTLTWDGKDETGLYVSNGLYFVYAIAKRGTEVRKVKLKIAVIR